MRPTIHAGAAVLTLLLAGQACGGSTQTGTETRTPTASRFVISEEEVRAGMFTDAYNAVQRLRPQWLVKRGQHSIRNEVDIIIYFNNTRAGGPDALRTIRVDDVVQIRFFDATAATQRWGTGHTHGAIQVVTLRSAGG